MEEMTFEEAKKVYEVLKNKPRATDERYRCLKEKYKGMLNEASVKVYSKRAELSNDVIIFSNDSPEIRVIVEGEERYSTRLYPSSYEEKSFKEEIERVLLTMIAHFCNEVNHIEEISLFISKIKEVLNKITEDFVNQVVSYSKEYTRASRMYSNFERAVTHRNNNSSNIYDILYRAWRREEALGEGTVLNVTTGPKWNSWRKVSSTKQGDNGLIIYFTNGTRTSLSNINFHNSFRNANPEFNYF